MQQDEKVRKLFATALFILVVAVVLYALLPFVNALFGSVLLYFLFRPLYLFFHKNGLSRPLSASLVIIISLLVLIVPLGFGSTLVVQEISGGLSDPSIIVSKISAIDASLPFVDLTSFVDNFFGVVVNFAKTLLLSAVNNITRMLIQLTIAYFLFYFMLIDSENLNDKIKSFLPFNEKNSKRLVEQFDTVTHSTVVTTGLIALLQGGLLGAGFAILGIKSAFFWGFIGILISFLPFVGIPLIWIPTALIQLFSGNLFIGFAVLAWGSFLSTIDNFLRPYIQNRVGKIHPLITLVGVFIGLPLFGILGLVIGPLLLSYALSITEMYVEEYV
ncbi:MAG: AI-2E family transporter [Nanoarchaeota archaeon]|nr:AI-2E family transporter [Nanoarchaeota archaeon]